MNLLDLAKRGNNGKDAGATFMMMQFLLISRHLTSSLVIALVLIVDLSGELAQAEPGLKKDVGRMDWQDAASYNTQVAFAVCQMIDGVRRSGNSKSRCWRTSLTRCSSLAAEQVA